MFTKTRAIVLTLAVSAGFVSAAIAPSVSLAQKNEGGAHAATCEIYRLTYELTDELQQTAFEKGQDDLQAYYLEEENAARDAARAAGCAWAANPAIVKAPVVAKLPVSVKLPGTIVKPIAQKPAAAKRHR